MINTGFDWQPETRIVYGNNSIDRVGEIADEIGANKILLITDPGIVAAGHVDHACRSLEAAGLNITLFDEVEENPTTRVVDKCLKVACSSKIDTLIGLGGGSSLDTAKGCNFLLTNGGQMRDYWGMGKATKPMLPMIAIPTTAGTGSECQSFALIADEETHQKMACGDSKAAARVAILDPVLTLSQPRPVTVHTGFDAVSHAIETAVTKKRTALSWHFSREAFKLCISAFPRILDQPDDLDARGQMLLGAAFAGTAIENSMLGAAHSAANPLTAHYGIVHGEAVGMMLPSVLRFNGEDLSTRKVYLELAKSGGLISNNEGIDNGIDELINYLESLLNEAGFPGSLSDHGVPRSEINRLADEASRQWTARFNPRLVTANDFKGLYQAAFSGRPDS